MLCVAAARSLAALNQSLEILWRSELEPGDMLQNHSLCFSASGASQQRTHLRCVTPKAKDGWLVSASQECSPEVLALPMSRSFEDEVPLKGHSRLHFLSGICVESMLSMRSQLHECDVLVITTSYFREKERQSVRVKPGRLGLRLYEDAAGLTVSEVTDGAQESLIEAGVAEGYTVCCFAGLDARGWSLRDLDEAQPAPTPELEDEPSCQVKIFSERTHQRLARICLPYFSGGGPESASNVAQLPECDELLVGAALCLVRFNTAGEVLQRVPLLILPASLTIAGGFLMMASEKRLFGACTKTFLSRTCVGFDPEHPPAVEAPDHLVRAPEVYEDMTRLVNQGWEELSAPESDESEPRPRDSDAEDSDSTVDIDRAECSPFLHSCHPHPIVLRRCSGGGQSALRNICCVCWRLNPPKLLLC